MLASGPCISWRDPHVFLGRLAWREIRDSQGGCNPPVAFIQNLQRAIISYSAGELHPPAG